MRSHPRLREEKFDAETAMLDDGMPDHDPRRFGGRTPRCRVQSLSTSPTEEDQETGAGLAIDCALQLAGSEKGHET